MKILKYQLCIVLILYFTSCKTALDSSNAHPNSLLGNTDLPKDELRPFMSQSVWEGFIQIPYDGFVKLRGSISDNGEILNLRIVESYPDRKRDKMALKWAHSARTDPVKIGSHIAPSADVFVVFYESHSDPNKALVIARQNKAANFAHTIGGGYEIAVYTY